MSAPRITISLRIRGEDLDPDGITELLRCQPRYAVRKGQDLARGGFVRPAPTGVWVYERPESSQVSAFDEQVQAVLDAVSDDVEIWRRLSERFTCELFVGVFLQERNQGFSIAALTMRELARRGIGLALDIYSAEAVGVRS